MFVHGMGLGNIFFWNRILKILASIDRIWKYFSQESDFERVFSGKESQRISNSVLFLLKNRILK